MKNKTLLSGMLIIGFMFFSNIVFGAWDFDLLKDEEYATSQERGNFADIYVDNDTIKAFSSWGTIATKILVSNDKGETWVEEFRDDNPYIGMDAAGMKCGDYKNGHTVVGLGAGYVFIKKAGSAVYNRIKTSSDLAIKRVQIVGNDIYVSTANEVLLTKDFGTTWDLIYEVPDRLLMDFKIFDNDRLFVYSSVNAQDVIFHISTDGGNTWDLNKSDIDFRSYHMSFIDSVGWACGPIDNTAADADAGDMVNVVFKTTNYGKSWTRIYDLENDQKKSVIGLLDIDFINAKEGVAVGYMPHSCKVIITKDGGATWEKLELEHGKSSGIYNYCTCMEPSGNILVAAANAGIYRISPSTSVPFLRSSNNIIYPVPCATNAKIYVGFENDKTSNCTCRIFNSAGKMMTEKRDLNLVKGYHSLDFNTTGFTIGTYFLVIESDGEIIAREKFIVK